MMRLRRLFGNTIMAQSLAKILIHLVYSTKNRVPMLPHEPFVDLHTYCRGILENHKCHLIEMNNVRDHVHVLFDLHRTEALSGIVQQLKIGSSIWLKEQGFKDFDWQDGFGAFSLGQSQRGETIDYFRRQQIKHATVSFQDEFRDFLQRYEIEYDERYVWG